MIITTIIIHFYCRYLHLYLYTYYSVPLVPYCKYLLKFVIGTILLFILVHTVYTVCVINLFFKKIGWHLAVRYQGDTTSHNSNTLSRREFASYRLASRPFGTHSCIALLFLRQFSTLTIQLRVPSLPGSQCTTRLLLLHFRMKRYQQ